MQQCTSIMLLFARDYTQVFTCFYSNEKAFRLGTLDVTSSAGRGEGWLKVAERAKPVGFLTWGFEPRKRVLQVGHQRASIKVRMNGKRGGEITSLDRGCPSSPCYAMRTTSLPATFWATLWGSLLGGVAALGDVVVQEVAVGATAELPCPSSDDGHRFQFWQLQGNQVLGPGNEIDHTKYKYDVLTGKLHIKAISSTEAGFYTCVSKGLANASFNSKSVELVVKKDWEEVYESDYETNLFRGLIAMGVLIIILIIGVIIYTLRRHRIVRFRDMSDEESPDEAPRGGTYNVSSMPTMVNENVNGQGIDNPTLETDFPKVFKTLQTTSDSQI